MTTKEQESIGGAGQVGRAAGREDAAESAARGELPSVIVSPEAYTPSDSPPRAAESSDGNGHDQPTAGANASGESAAPAQPESEPSASAPQAAPVANAPAPSATTEAGSHSDAPDFSEADADRFAAKFRPSWEAVPSALTAAVTAPQSSAPSSAPPRASLPATPAYDEPEPDVISAFPGAAQRRRALWMTGAAVIGFVALFALALRSSHTAVPQKKASLKASAAREHESAPSASAAHAPNPSQTPPSAPVVPPSLPVAAPPAEPPPSTPAPEANTVSAAATAPAVPSAPAPAPSATPLAAATPVPSAEPPAAAAPVPAAPKSEAPSLVRIRVATVPAGAELTVDGALVPNPFETNMPRGGKHRLRAHTDGYHSRELSVVLDHDQDVELRLDKREESKPIRPPAPAPSASRSVRRAPASIPLARPVAPRRPSPPPANRGAGFVSESPY